MQIAGLFLGSGVMAAVVGMAGNLLVERLKHKHHKEDKQEEAEETQRYNIDGIGKRLDEFIGEVIKMREDSSRQSDKIDALTATVDTLVSNEIARTYIDIRRRSLSAIKKGVIKDSMKKRILDDYDRYKKLPNANGYLKDTIETMKELPVIIDDGDLEDMVV